MFIKVQINFVNVIIKYLSPLNMRHWAADCYASDFEIGAAHHSIFGLGKNRELGRHTTN